MKCIPLTQGFKTYVDDDDFKIHGKFSWFAKFSKHGNRPYVARSIRVGKKVKTIRLHREIMNTPDNMEVDHKDKDTLNNQKYNMENVTKKENLRRRN